MLDLPHFLLCCLVDEGRVADVVYLDFSNAFDMISYNILLGPPMKIQIGKEDHRTDRKHPKFPG